MPHELTEWWVGWWDLLTDFYRVNPIIFLGIYALKSPLYWWSLYQIVQRARRRRWQGLPGLVLFTLGLNLTPWIYVYFFGRNLPWWYTWLLAGLALMALAWLVWQVRRKLHEYPGNDLEAAPGGPASHPAGP